MNFAVETLGPCYISSPLKLSKVEGDYITNYMDNKARVLADISLASFHDHVQKNQDPPSFEMAGPREMVYFGPSKLHCAIVTCGGLCPGINDVIRSVVLELWHCYGVRHILGVRYGYSGFDPEQGYDMENLTPEVVANINNTGGTVLGSSRGHVPAEVIADCLERMNVQVLFTIGGDGTQKGALAVHKEVQKRGLKIAVVGIPKTIDNDVMFVEKTFGFETAVSVAVEAVRGAHVEARGAHNGIGVVKLMGRDSGFIAASAALAAHEVNFVLVPEVPFHMDGENGFLKHLLDRLNDRHHAVVCVAEGAGQNLFVKDANKQEHDASGNVKYADIGKFICQEIKKDLHAKHVNFALKYIDPSYMIRSAPAIPSDSVYCAELGQNAVHAAMAGRTGMIVGSWNGVITHVPMEAIVGQRKKIDPDNLFWANVIGSTGQPHNMLNS